MSCGPMVTVVSLAVATRLPILAMEAGISIPLLTHLDITHSPSSSGAGSPEGAPAEADSDGAVSATAGSPRCKVSSASPIPGDVANFLGRVWPVTVRQIFQ